MRPSAGEVREALTADQARALDVIVLAAEAWTTIAALALEDVADATLAELVGLELVERWDPPLAGPGMREELATLTPWGAYVLGVEIDERMTVEDGDAIEVPFWVMRGKGSDCVVLPKHARECCLPFPELVPDRESEPEDAEVDVEPRYLIDPWTEEPVAIWGVPVEIERRQRSRRQARA